MTEGSSENFSLRWDSFHSNLSTSFHTLLQGEELVDVTVAAEGRFVQAHKLVLSVCSPYFKSLFKVNPCQHPIVILKDVGHKELVSVLEFMYRGEVNISQEDLTEFLKTAELLQIKGLTGDDTPGEQGQQETKTKDTPARQPPPPPPPDPQPPKVRTSTKSPVKVASPQPMTPKIPQPPFMAETDSKSEVLQPPPQKRMRQEPRQESPQYNPQRRSPSAPHATMLQTSTPSRNPISNTSESSVDEDYTHRDLEYVEVPTAKVEPVEIDSDIEEVDTNFDESTDFSEFFAGQSSQQQPFQDFSAVGLPEGGSGASQAMGIPQEAEQGGFQIVCGVRGKPQLVHDGYLFSIHSCSAKTVTWRCSNHTVCRARVHTHGNKLTVKCGEHSHEPHTRKIQSLRILFEEQEAGEVYAGGIQIQ